MRGALETGSVQAIEALLAWWALAGVDTAVAEESRDWLRPAPRPVARPIPSPAAASITSPATAAPAPHPAPVRPAIPEDLDGFRAWLVNEPSLPETSWTTQKILPQGFAGARLMIVGDVPDPDDSPDGPGEGSLFSGQAGKLLDAMLAAIGQQRADCYVASLATARPPGGIIPAPDIAQLVERMRHHIALVKPHRLLILGDKTSRALLPPESRTARRGLLNVNLSDGNVPAVATFHPRLLLRQPAAKAECWKALQMLIEDRDQ